MTTGITYTPRPGDSISERIRGREQARVGD
jgi:hypothetical protein